MRFPVMGRTARSYFTYLIRRAPTIFMLVVLRVKENSLLFTGGNLYSKAIAKNHLFLSIQSTSFCVVNACMMAMIKSKATLPARYKRL